MSSAQPRGGGGGPGFHAHLPLPLRYVFIDEGKLTLTTERPPGLCLLKLSRCPRPHGAAPGVPCEGVLTLTHVTHLKVLASLQ